MTAPNLIGVAATALTPLRARATDAAGPLSLLGDVAALTLARALALAPTPAPATLGPVVRSLVIDRWVTRWAAQHPGGAVLELGVGLGTRHHRLRHLGLRWLEVDLPALIAVRCRLLPATPSRQLIGLDLDTLGPDAIPVDPDLPRPWCVIAEAVSSYLRPSTLALIARVTALGGAGSQLIVDGSRRDGAPPVLPAFLRGGRVALVETCEGLDVHRRDDRRPAAVPLRIHRFAAAPARCRPS